MAKKIDTIHLTFYIHTGTHLLSTNTLFMSEMVSSLSNLHNFLYLNIFLLLISWVDLCFSSNSWVISDFFRFRYFKWYIVYFLLFHLFLIFCLFFLLFSVFFHFLSFYTLTFNCWFSSFLLLLLFFFVSFFMLNFTDLIFFLNWFNFFLWIKKLLNNQLENSVNK